MNCNADNKINTDWQKSRMDWMVNTWIFELLNYLFQNLTLTNNKGGTKLWGQCSSWAVTECTNAIVNLHLKKECKHFLNEWLNNDLCRTIMKCTVNFKHCLSGNANVSRAANSTTTNRHCSMKQHKFLSEENAALSKLIACVFFMLWCRPWLRSLWGNMLQAPCQPFIWLCFLDSAPFLFPLQLFNKT